jgi:hypothetical protein
MVKAVALNAIHLCKSPGERSPEGKTLKFAEIEVAQPGSIIDVPKKELDDLKAKGAAREATKADIAAAAALAAEDDSKLV